jgi:hypothetical protein
MRIALRPVHLLAVALLAAWLLVGACGESDSVEETVSGPAASATPPLAGVASSTGEATPATGQAQGKVDPCALLTREQVDAAASEPMRSGERSAEAMNPLGQQICTWSAVSGQSTRTLQVSVVRSQDMDENLRKSSYTARRLFLDTKAGLPGAEPVSGVGDDAFRAQNFLHTLKGDVYVTVFVSVGQIGTQRAPATTDTLKELALAVLAKLVI